MTTLASRTLLQFSRRSARQALRPHRQTFVSQRRTFALSQCRRQTPQESNEAEDFAGLNDAPVFIEDDTTQVDWSRSFHGLSTQPFSEEAAKVLTAPLVTDDVEIKPGMHMS
jgi:hypothetical protein